MRPRTRHIRREMKSDRQQQTLSSSGLTGRSSTPRLVEAALQIRRAQAQQSDPSQNGRSKYRADAFDHPAMVGGSLGWGIVAGALSVPATLLVSACGLFVVPFIPHRTKRRGGKADLSLQTPSMTGAAGDCC